MLGKNYCDSLRTPIDDKLFFLNHPHLFSVHSYDYIVDFGCADGSLVKELCQRTGFPSEKVIGVDRSAYMRKRFLINNPDAKVYSSLREAYNNTTLTLKNICLIYSSVFHELNTKQFNEVLAFNHQLSELNKKVTIVVRDMHIPPNYNVVNKRLADAVRADADLMQIETFEREYGSLNHVNNLLHFLLKEPYKVRWANEMAEDYTSFNLSRLVGLMSEYHIRYVKQFSIPPIREKAKKYHFRFTKTHIALIIEGGINV